MRQNSAITGNPVFSNIGIGAIEVANLCLRERFAEGCHAVLANASRVRLHTSGVWFVRISTRLRLTQESRWETFRLLVRSGTEGLPAGKVVGELGVPAATMSFHLKELTNAGLIEQRR